MLPQIIESDYFPVALFVALVCGVVLIVEVSTMLTSIFAPAPSPYEVLTDCVAKRKVAYQGVTFECEVKKP